MQFFIGVLGYNVMAGAQYISRSLCISSKPWKQPQFLSNVLLRVQKMQFLLLSFSPGKVWRLTHYPELLLDICRYLVSLYTTLLSQTEVLFSELTNKPYWRWQLKQRIIWKCKNCNCKATCIEEEANIIHKIQKTVFLLLIQIERLLLERAVAINIRRSSKVLKILRKECESARIKIADIRCHYLCKFYVIDAVAVGL